MAKTYMEIVAQLKDLEGKILSGMDAETKKTYEDLIKQSQDMATMLSNQDDIDEYQLYGDAATLIHNKTANTIRIKMSDAYIDFITRDMEKVADNKIAMEGRSVSDMDSYKLSSISNNADDFEFFFIDAGFGQKDAKGQLQVKKNGQVYGTYKASYEDYSNLTKRFIFCDLSSIGWQKDRITGEWTKLSAKNRKKAEVVMQNIFFSDAKELADYQEKQKAKQQSTPPASSTEKKDNDIPPPLGDDTPGDGGAKSMSDVGDDTGKDKGLATGGEDKSAPEAREEKASGKNDNDIDKQAEPGNELLTDSVKRDAEIIKRDIELEQAAIDEYTGQLKDASPELKKVLEHLIQQEKEHRKELEQRKVDKGTNVPTGTPPAVVKQDPKKVEDGKSQSGVATQPLKEMASNKKGINVKIATSVQSGDAWVRRFVDKDVYEYDKEFQNILKSDVSDDEKFTRLSDRVIEIVQGLPDDEENGVQIQSVDWDKIEINASDIQKIIDWHNEDKDDKISKKTSGKNNQLVDDAITREYDIIQKENGKISVDDMIDEIYNALEQNPVDELVMPFMPTRGYIKSIVMGLMKKEKKSEVTCDNTDHEGVCEDVKTVKLTDEFDGDECNWCKNCRERDIKMIEKELTEDKKADKSYDKIYDKIAEVLNADGFKTVIKTEGKGSDTEVSIVIEGVGTFVEVDSHQDEKSYYLDLMDMSNDKQIQIVQTGDSVNVQELVDYCNEKKGNKKAEDGKPGNADHDFVPTNDFAYDGKMDDKNAKGKQDAKITSDDVIKALDALWASGKDEFISIIDIYRELQKENKIGQDIDITKDTATTDIIRKTLKDKGWLSNRPDVKSGDKQEEGAFKLIAKDKGQKCPFCDDGHLKPLATKSPAHTVHEWSVCDKCEKLVKGDKLKKQEGYQETEVKMDKTDQNKNIEFLAEKKTAISKSSYVEHVPGHKNSQGETAEWVIKDHSTHEILKSFPTKEKAEEGLQNMHIHKGADFQHQTIQTRDIDPELVDQIRQIQQGIDPAILDESENEKNYLDKGIQLLLHSTILYGVEDADQDKLNEIVKKHLAKPIKVKNGNAIQYFDNEGQTCAYVPIQGEALHSLHDDLKKNVKNLDEHPDYIPHICVAYLQPKKRLKTEQLKPCEWDIVNIEVTDKKGKYHPIGKEDIDKKEWIPWKELVQNDGGPFNVDKVREEPINDTTRGTI